MTTAKMLLRLGAGVGFGVLIGLERQYRARMAGLRTNAPVAAGATVFALQSAQSRHNGTPAQVEVSATPRTHERDDKRMESAFSRLSFEPSVINVGRRVDEPDATGKKE